MFLSERDQFELTAAKADFFAVPGLDAGVPAFIGEFGQDAAAFFFN